MKKLIKKHNHSVDDFIIFLKAKIAIIILGTIILSSIIIYFQLDYKNYWDVRISRTVNKNAVMETYSIIKKNHLEEKMKRMENPEKYSFLVTNDINPVSFFLDLNKFTNSLMANILSNEEISYKQVTHKEKSEDVFKKKNYELIVQMKKVESEEYLIKKLNKLFLDLKNNSDQIIAMENGLDINKNFNIYNFRINEIIRISGYDKAKFLKIILIDLVVISFFAYVYHIRKFIKLF